MNKGLTTVVIRALLQAVAGALAARDVVVDNGTTELFAGGLVGAATVIWSVKEKNAIRASTQTIVKP